jgi:prepilin-type N-terminal cleavage/methylation domain-containing protein
MNKGFTIIELVITIFILSIAVVGIFNAFSIITILTADSSDRLTATYLAQEGMEIVRNIRDQNWLNIDARDSSATWSDGLEVCSNGCKTDYKMANNSENPLDVWASGETDYLKIDSSGNGFYNLTSGTNTKFKRKITITHPVDGSGTPIDYIMKVVVEVSWNKKATLLNSGWEAGTCKDNCIKAEETLYNWYNTFAPSSDVTVILEPNDYGITIDNDLIEITPNNFTANIYIIAGTTLTQLEDVLSMGQADQSWDKTGLSSTLEDGEQLIVQAQDTIKTATYTIIVTP